MNKLFIFIAPMTLAVSAFAAEKITVFPQTKSILPPVVTEKYEYYEIKGNSENQLRSELCRCGCRWKDGKTYDSETTWHVKWDYNYDQVPQACSADSFRAIVDISTRYPTWVRDNDVPQPLVDKWNNYMKSLMEHERVHRDMVVETTTELIRAVAELPPAPTCAELDRRIRTVCDSRLNKLDEESKSYDETTRHGIVQGAYFP